MLKSVNISLKLFNIIGNISAVKYIIFFVLFLLLEILKILFSAV